MDGYGESEFMVECDGSGWAVALRGDRAYLEGFVDGLTSSWPRCWWMEGLTKRTRFIFYVDGYVDGVLSAMRRALPPVRMN